MVGAYVVALQSRGLGREAFTLAAAALGLNVLVTMLLAWTWRTAELTYVAVFHFVTATYLVLFSVGKNDPAMAYVLGLAAVVEAIMLWGSGFPVSEFATRGPRNAPGRSITGPFC